MACTLSTVLYNIIICHLHKKGASVEYFAMINKNLNVILAAIHMHRHEEMECRSLFEAL